jgi:hypothetical protein
MKRNFEKQLAAKWVAGIIVFSSTILLVSCTSGVSGSTTSATNLGSTVSKAMSTISKNSPHVVNSTTVQASNMQKYFKQFMRSLLPEVMAGVPNPTSGLAAIWDPEGAGSPPINGDLGLINSFFDSSVLYGCSSGATRSANHTDGPCSDGSSDWEYTTPTSGGTLIPTFVSPMDYFGQQLDPNFVNANGSSTTTFGRMQSAMGITCVIGNLFSNLDADGTPSVTAGATLTFPSDTSNVVFQPVANGGCGMQVSMASASITGVVVTAVVGSSYYTKKLSIQPPGNPNPSIIYLGLDLTEGTMNFMTIEDQAGPSGRNAIDRTILSATGLTSAATTVIKYEYASIGYPGTRSLVTCWDGSQWNCDYEFHRVFIDGPNDKAYILSNDGAPGDAAGGTTTPTFFIQFTGAGRPIELAACTASSCSETLALSLAVSGQNTGAGGSAVATDDYNACVNASDRTIATNNVLTCNVTGTTIDRGFSDTNASPAGVIELSRVFYQTETIANTPDILTVNPNATVSFTNGTDMYTAPTAL